MRRGVGTDTNISEQREILRAPKARAHRGFFRQLLPQKISKSRILEILFSGFSSLHMNVSNVIKSKITGTFGHDNNIFVLLGAFTHSDTYRLSTRNVLQNSTCAARYLGAKA